jgi:hypothetical protein
MNGLLGKYDLMGDIHRLDHYASPILIYKKRGSFKEPLQGYRNLNVEI